MGDTNHFQKQIKREKFKKFLQIDSTLADAYIHILSFGCYDRCVTKNGSKTQSIMNLCVNFFFFFEKKNYVSIKKRKKRRRDKANENYIIRKTSSITNEFLFQI